VHLALAGRAECVRDVWVGGEQCVRAGEHAAEPQVRAAFQRRTR
jgi:cytosine/adenosine deaminase-related metal-dependent hydrolase